MLHLQSESQARWLRQVDENLEEILIDHAHCEHKAAATAMSLLGAYVDCEELTREMAVIIAEELEHFQMVLDLLKRRGIAFRKIRPGDYGRRLNMLVRANEPDRAVDRLLIAGLIEARSCERFKLLKDYIQDVELADFYGSLFESEARHHSSYVRLARRFQDHDRVKARLEELALAEAAIIDTGHLLPRMHS
ncbi:MAG: tRNA-(ms[2]io[6]A)-hydroxylase [Planctomycetota bacterium]|jgi:tRNA-(ms[2]io[6]A)-hydroxylase|nr:tRNA-(ms[2]io[6]A)-hydroxylase [Planctomycetota bacterium]